MAVIRNENYILIQGWMITELNLKGNELMVYGIIYGYSQSENQRYTGSHQYLADWCNCSKRSIYNILEELINKNYIFKEERNINGVKFCEYGVTNFTSGEKISLGGGEKISPNNKDINNLEGKENIISNRNIKEKKVYGTFDNVKLTDEEYQKLVEKFPNDYQNKIDKLSEYIASKGKKYSSHYATILSWARKEEEENKPKVSPSNTKRVFRDRTGMI